jgi:hypothetical protein
MADRSRPPARPAHPRAGAGLLAVVAAELAIAAVTALTSGVSWAAAVGSFTVTNGVMGLGFAVCGAIASMIRSPTRSAALCARPWMGADYATRREPSAWGRR